VTSILFDQDFSIKPKRTEESLIQGRIHIKKVLHKLTNELSIIISDCDMSQMRFETESYIKKDKEVAVEAAKIFERVAKDLRGLSKEMDTAEI
jgi:two-component sensor histidine kinase